MTCSPKLPCNINDKNTNIRKDIVLFLCYEFMSILPLNFVYSSTETLSMIISIKTYVLTLKDFVCFALYDFSQLLLCFPANVFTLSPSACHIFISINTAIEVLFHYMKPERTWQCSDFHALKLLWC